MMMGFHTHSQLHPECSIEKSRWSFCRILPKSGEQDQQKAIKQNLNKKNPQIFFRAFTLRIFITKEKRQSGKKGFHFVSSASTNTLWLYVFNLPQVQVTIKSCYPREILIYALCPVLRYNNKPKRSSYGQHLFYNFFLKPRDILNYAFSQPPQH